MVFILEARKLSQCLISMSIKTNRFTLCDVQEEIQQRFHTCATESFMEDFICQPDVGCPNNNLKNNGLNHEFGCFI